jgi:Transmembrane secretion effector
MREPWPIPVGPGEGRLTEPTRPLSLPASTAASAPNVWTERYRCPTWFDYLRQRNRATRSETATEQQAIAFHVGPGPVRVRRMLERPFGSVRSKDHKTDMAPQAETTATTAASPAIEVAPAAPAARVIARPKRT